MGVTIILDDGEARNVLTQSKETASRIVLIIGNINLRGYRHPLPVLREIQGDADLWGYAHPPTRSHQNQWNGTPKRLFAFAHFTRRNRRGC